MPQARSQGGLSHRQSRKVPDVTRPDPHVLRRVGFPPELRAERRIDLACRFGPFVCETLVGGGRRQRGAGELCEDAAGVMTSPARPDIAGAVMEPVIPGKTRVVTKRIPSISTQARMPHPYWGDCAKCHLIRGASPARGGWKSPVGEFFSKVSTLKKVGPPIKPGSIRPHPDAGRCIKCHDIVMEVPVGKQTFAGRLSFTFPSRASQASARHIGVGRPPPFST